MRRRIVLLGDEVLRKKAKPVKEVDASVRRLIDDLTDTLEEAQGLGLAAPQIGVAKRVFVARDGDRVLALVNPQIVERSGRDVGIEGCLSMPGLQGNVPRAKKVSIRALDRAGRTVSYDAEDLLARVFQHENDHLNGVLFIDHTRDIWWLERVEPEEAVASDDTEEADDDEEGVVIVKRVRTTAREVETWFLEESQEEGQRA